MNIKLTKDEHDLLSQGGFLLPELLEKVRGAAFDTKGARIELSEAEADAIRDACDDELVKRGFDAEYEPTKVGRLLESMIDKFFTG